MKGVKVVVKVKLQQKRVLETNLYSNFPNVGLKREEKATKTIKRKRETKINVH